MNLDDIIRTIQKSGCVGETMPLKCIILIICGIRCKNRRGTSLNLHADDNAGLGKDHVIQAVRKLAFTDDWIHTISPSKTGITYMCKGDIDALKDKIVYIEDPGSDYLDCDDFKMLITDEINTIRLINFSPTQIKSKKPVVIVTTAALGKNHQVTQRLPSIKFDSSFEQTDAITKYQLDLACGKAVVATKEEMDAVSAHFDSLEYVTVNLSNIMGMLESERNKDATTKMRRIYQRLLDYIKFSAVLHQNEDDRMKDGSTIFATKEDFDNGLEIFNFIYRKKGESKITTMGKRQSSILKYLKTHPYTEFTVNQIMADPDTEDASYPTVQSDIRKLSQEHKKIWIGSKYPQTYSWEEPDQPDEEVEEEFKK